MVSSKYYVYFVYIIRSERQPNQRYVGSTENLKRRLSDHNLGRSPYTRKYRPWSLEVYVKFSDPEKALAFERYLKTGAGRAFTRRHF